MARKRYALIGTGGRARSFYRAVARDFRDTAELVAFCDLNQTRMDYANRMLQEECDHPPVPTYTAEQFEEMIRTEKPDEVIVTTIDRTHDRYIIRAMELGCDVVSEKPMTTDERKCQAILDAVRRTGKNLRVTFNYRYGPCATKVAETLRTGVLGEFKCIHFEWLLNVRHGADYFRRWHRDKRNSGGLMVHKATHHFDLINWWTESLPETVFGFGDLKFYGRANAEERGVTNFYHRGTGDEAAKGDPFALDLSGQPHLKSLYLDAEHEDGYLRDLNVFGDGISIEDTMNVLVRYRNGCQMSYSLSAFNPWEGYNVSILGTKGRIEIAEAHASYINAGGDIGDEGKNTYSRIRVHPMREQPYDVEVPEVEGGHGGADPVMFNDIFGTPEPDPLGRAASHIDGAYSILTGIAANKSFATGRPVEIASLVRFD